MAATGGDDDNVPRADLLAVVAGVVSVLAVVFTPLGDWRPLALAVGLSFVLVVPGYALVSAVFPRAGETTPDGRQSWVSRLLLSVAGSVIAVAVVGVALDFTVWGFQRGAVVLGLSAFSLVASGVAWYRRRQIPADVRAGASGDAVRARARELVVGDGPAGVVLTVLVVAVAVGGVAVVAEDATASGTVTEFYILGQNESGELVAGNYPSNVTVGEPTTVGIGVGTTRPAGFDGRVVASLERVETDGESVTVTESRRLGSFDVQAAAGERSVRRHTVQPTLVGENLRLTYRLYENGAETPLRRVQIWLTVTPQS
jgi:uncharacterized membrane protein